MNCFLCRFTLRKKFILFTLLVAVIPTCIITSVQYYQSRKVVENIAAAQLASTTRSYSEKLSNIFQSVERDAKVLIETPSMVGISNALRPQERETSSTSDAMHWKAELEEQFSSLLAARDIYNRISLFDLQNAGRELVNTFRTDQGIEVAEKKQRQLQGNHPRTLKQTLSGHRQTFDSEVIINRGSMDSATRETPSIQFTFPVYDSSNTLFGVVQIDADLHVMMEEALPQLPKGHTVILTSLAGDFVEYDAQNTELAYYFRTESDWSEPPFYKILRKTGLSESLNSVGDEISYFVRTDLGDLYDSVFADVIVTASKDVLLKESNGAMSSGLIISGILAVFFATLAAILVSRILEPLRQLTEKISGSNDRLEFIVLDHSRNDEIGELTDAFSNLSNRLIERSAFADAVFKGAADGIVAIDQHSEILAVNPAAEKIFGHKASEMQGKYIDMLLPAAVRDEHRQFVENAVITENGRLMAENRDVKGLRSDGTEIPLEISISYVFDKARKTTIGIVRDVSERRKAELHRQEMIAALERSNTELDSFAYIASHDLKAPLRVIDNASRWLEEDLEEFLDDDTRESMALLRNRIVRMERLLDDLLEHSRIGRVTLPEETVSGDELMENVIALVAPSQRFTIEVAPEFASIQLPRMPVQAVMLNLVSNSIKHHDLESGNIKVTVRDMSDHYEFTVTDDGPGIPSEFHQKVFGMFQTLRPRDELEASGMGLAMVKKHVEVAGGQVKLSSDSGRGCSLSFTWPKKMRSNWNLENAA